MNKNKQGKPNLKKNYECNRGTCILRVCQLLNNLLVFFLENAANREIGCWLQQKLSVLNTEIECRNVKSGRKNCKVFYCIINVLVLHDIFFKWQQSFVPPLHCMCNGHPTTQMRDWIWCQRWTDTYFDFTVYYLQIHTRNAFKFVLESFTIT